MEDAMTLDDLLFDIHVLEYDLRSYERKYGMLSEIFYEAYSQGQEPPDENWVRDWTAWAGAYQVWLRYRQEYRGAIEKLRNNQTIAETIRITSRHEPIPVFA
jgi:hypothetical protein